jgi:hypothetical protein
MMDRCASFHADKARWERCEERQHLAPSQLLAGHSAGAVKAMDLEDAIGQIEADRGNLHSGWSLHTGLPDDSHPMAHRRRTQGQELNVAGRQEVGRWANNRAENSHQPFRRRERATLRFWRMKTLQQFVSTHAAFHNHFNQERNLVSREIYRERRSAALAAWQTFAA